LGNVFEQQVFLGSKSSIIPLSCHINSMTKGSQQPAERHQTHSKNATTHPGSIVLEMLGV
jgi:hypothetical protein